MQLDKAACIKFVDEALQANLLFHKNRKNLHDSFTKCYPGNVGQAKVTFPQRSFWAIKGLLMMRTETMKENDAAMLSFQEALMMLHSACLEEHKDEALQMEQDEESFDLRDNPPPDFKAGQKERARKERQKELGDKKDDPSVV